VRTAVQLEIELDIAMGELRRAMPTRVMVMEVGADELLPDGSARVRTMILRGAVRDRAGANVPIEGLVAQANLVAGVETVGTLTPRGRVTDAKVTRTGVELPAAAQRQVADSLEQTAELAMPLPEPAVGVGAIWRFRRPVKVLDVTMETVTEVEVTAITEQRVAFRSRTVVTGRDQRATIEGTAIDVAKIHGAGRGEGTLDLGRMALTSAQTLELGFQVAAGSNRAAATLKLASRLGPPR
jgi:hypothetical protein